MLPSIEFIFVSTFTILILSLTSVTSLCVTTDNSLICNVGSGSNLIDTLIYNTTFVNNTRIIYNGSVTLQLAVLSTKWILIEPASESDEHSLQITSITTNATDMDIRVRLSPNQAGKTLLPVPSAFSATNLALRVRVTQNSSTTATLKIADGRQSGTINLMNLEVIFSDSVSSPGTLNLPNLLAGLTISSGVTISGNRHDLSMAGANNPLSTTIKQLALKKLRLQERILDSFADLETYQVEECQYDQTSQFLNSNKTLNLSLIMINNTPLNSRLPNGDQAFTGLTNFIAMTIIEPQFNSSILNALKMLRRLPTLTLELGSYDMLDFKSYIDVNPVVFQLTINNIKNLEVLPNLFFNRLNTVRKTTLRGTFGLEKKAICLFYGMATPSYATYPLLSVESPLQNATNSGWNRCAAIYIDAINTRSVSEARCPPDNSPGDCQQLIVDAARCNFSNYETNECPKLEFDKGPTFSFRNSSLYRFMLDYLRRNQTGTDTTSSEKESLNIAAIIGALCALLLAITVLTATVFCIRRYRRREASKYLSSSPVQKDEPPPYDFSHLSIATSKTSYSTNRAHQKSIFPPLQPNDEIAPPLYTAPSESAAPLSNFKAPSAPLYRRDSITTQGTHVYETLDP